MCFKNVWFVGNKAKMKHKLILKQSHQRKTTLEIVLILKNSPSWNAHTHTKKKLQKYYNAYSWRPSIASWLISLSDKSNEKWRWKRKTCM